MNDLYTRKSNKELFLYLKNNRKLTVITWGLSKKTKEIIHNNIIKIDLIIEKNEKLHGTLFKNIPIVSFCDIQSNHNNLLLLWGNNCEEILQFLETSKIKIKTILVQDEVSALFGITSNYLNSNLTLNQKKDLFKKMVSHIEIEPHSYCNRTCWFCPNSFIDRKHTVNYMDQNILECLLKDLQKIQYDRTIAFTRYSEPFGNEVFYETLKKVRSYLPNAILHANTNSDFLNNNTLLKAYENGLNRLLIQLYFEKDEPFNFKNAEKKANEIQKKVSNLKITLLFNKKDWVEYRCEYKDMIIRMYARNFKKNGVNRGNLKIQNNEYRRFSICTVPFTDVYIDYNCKLVPCCNIRSDNPAQKNMTFGQLSDSANSIFDVFFSTLALKWRKSLFNFNEKLFPPCNDCNFRVVQKTPIINYHVKSVLNEI